MTSELSGGKVDYSVSTGGSTIYTGRAYADTAGNCKVVLNDIFKDYLGKPDFNPYGAITDTRAIVEFSVAYGSSGTAWYSVVNDWSYEQNYWSDGSVQEMNAPIDEYWGENEIRFACFKSVALYSIYYRDILGRVVDSTEGVIFTGTSLCLPMESEFGEGSVQLILWDDENNSIEKNYTIKNDCRVAATLLYRNEWGGYDTLPLATCVESRSYSREGYEVRGDTAAAYIHQRRDTRADVRKTYTLRTFTLTDGQAAQMHNAIGSTQAWLSVGGGTLQAVTIVTSECKRKTFRNEGRKRVEYEIVCETAIPMERR